MSSMSTAAEEGDSCNPLLRMATVARLHALELHFISSSLHQHFNHSISTLISHRIAPHYHAAALHANASVLALYPAPPLMTTHAMRGPATHAPTAAAPCSIGPLLVPRVTSKPPLHRSQTCQSCSAQNAATPASSVSPAWSIPQAGSGCFQKDGRLRACARRMSAGQSTRCLCRRCNYIAIT